MTGAENHLLNQESLLNSAEIIRARSEGLLPGILCVTISSKRST